MRKTTEERDRVLCLVQEAWELHPDFSLDQLMSYYREGLSQHMRDETLVRKITKEKHG